MSVYTTKNHNQKTKIHVIATGGTIAGLSNKDSNGYTAGVIPVADLVKKANFSNNIEITSTQLFNIPSENMSFKNCIELYNTIKKLEKTVNAFVITHGTDTIEETMYFLNLLELESLIIFTCSLKPYDAIGTDAAYNFQNAIELAKVASDINKKGIFLSVNDDVIPACGVQKNHTTAINSFVNRFPNDFFTNNNLFQQDNPPKFKLNNEEFNSNVEIVQAYMEPSVKLIKALEGSKGVVYAGFGAGTMPNNIKEALKDLSNNGTFVIRASELPFGNVLPDDSYENDNYKFIASYNKSAKKARILLSVILNTTKNITYKKVQQCFTIY